MNRAVFPVAAAVLLVGLYRSLPADGGASGTGVEAGSTYYRNCDAARAAGSAPIHRGEPGYREPLDRDNDGIACEPYRGRF